MNLFFLKKYKNICDKAIKELIFSMKEENDLSKACKYALLSDGKRIRPILVMLIAESLNKGYDVTSSALAVELFHTASLIADDLPSMDDEDIRRNKPSLHLAFNEGIALLVSYTFISYGYEFIVKNSKELNIGESFANKLCIKAIEEVSKIAGLRGATNGQFLDLFPPNNSIETIFKIIEQKTVSLFEICFVFGWLFGGGDISELSNAKMCAKHFGMAFQIADDLIDIKQDKGKNNLNIAIALGEKKARELFFKEMENFKNASKKINLYSSHFKKICDFLIKSIKNRQ